MRIIGGKDYYDSAIAYGIDPGIVYVRREFRLTNGDMKKVGRYVGKGFFITPEDAEIKDWRTRYDYERGHVENNVKLEIQEPQVIFCGKIYSGVFLSITEKQNAEEVVSKHHFWSEDKFNQFLEEKKWKAVEARPRFGEDKARVLEQTFARRDVSKDVFNFLVAKQIVSISIKEIPLGEWMANRPAYPSSPGWIDAPTDWVANSDNLKDWDFQKAVDPVAAFQEVSQWVGGTLSATNGPNTVTITDDNVKLAKHGMDKWSFRKKTEKSK